MTETTFKKVDYTLKSLLSYIEMGEIGLPDIQRPFVWKNAKVRDLFDSMYRGFPVGYLLFWNNELTDSRGIGVSEKIKPPRLLVVDGQQRLTSLYAVLRGIEVVRSDYSKERIAIAFNPQLERFEVADAAIRRDRSFIPDISTLWSEDGDLFDVVEEYLENVESHREVSRDEKKAIKKRIQRVHALEGFPFTALELASQIDEEQVAEVFVRINSKGEELKQADFILTLMSVFWDEGRAELEDFCRRSRIPTTSAASPFNHFIEPSPDQLLRVSVAVAFGRARLQYVYSILRGKDLETGEVSSERREAQFEALKAAQAEVLNLQYWHDYLKAIQLAGYRGGRMITSRTNLVYVYALYLLGRRRHHVPEHELRRAIARWFFMAQMTGRYTGSSEAALEFDLRQLEPVASADEFLALVDRVCADNLTNDFWGITLPNDLAKASYYSPSLSAYNAALVLLDAKALFSDHSVSDLLDPSIHSNRSAVERHHLFPRAYLKSLGMDSKLDTDQIANYALTDWSDNQAISDRPPAEYVPEMHARWSPDMLQKMYHWHALPDGWQHMDYRSFLEKRRELMAKVVREAYESLRDEQKDNLAVERTVLDLVKIGEGTQVEFKSTLRVNLHTGQKDPRMEHAVIKTIAGFLNSRAGGRLVIGVADDGSAVGLEPDGFPNEDKMALHLTNLLLSRMDEKFGMYVHIHFEDYNGSRALVVDCSPARSPAYVKDGNTERFYVRQGPSTPELPPSQIPDYIKQRFE